MTKIFLDSGDPLETRTALARLEFLDGQTTNPSLVAKNPEAVGNKFTSEEIYNFYKKVVQEISSLIPAGSVSIEVYANANTSAEEMLKQAREFWLWIPNAHIKYPTTKEGLKAAEISIKEGMKVNMTLIFTQEQAAAVYSATKGAKKGDVFVSPFIGRLDDIGLQGTDLIQNIMEMYKAGDGHVEVLAASTRNMQHLSQIFKMGVDIVTMPLSLLENWKSQGLTVEALASVKDLTPIDYKVINLDSPWESYNVHHELTVKGLEKFAQDWNALIK